MKNCHSFDMQLYYFSLRILHYIFAHNDIIQSYFSRFFKKRIKELHKYTLCTKKSKFLTCIHYTHIHLKYKLRNILTNHTILRVNIKIDKHKTGFCHSEAFSFSNIKFIKNIWLFIFTWFFQKKIKHYGKTFGKQSGPNYSRSSRYHYIVILNLMK